MSPLVCTFILSAWLAAVTSLDRELPCTGRHRDNRTTFSIQDYPEVSEESCEYSWCDQAGVIIANQEEGGAPGLVRRHTVRSLVTSGCQDAASYEGRCWPKWEKIVARCTFTCAEKPAVPEEMTEQNNVADVIGVPSSLVFWCFSLLLWCF